MYEAVFDVSEESEYRASAVLGQYFHISSQTVQVCTYTGFYAGCVYFCCIICMYM